MLFFGIKETIKESLSHLLCKTFTGLKFDEAFSSLRFGINDTSSRGDIIMLMKSLQKDCSQDIKEDDIKKFFDELSECITRTSLLKGVLRIFMRKDFFLSSIFEAINGCPEWYKNDFFENYTINLQSKKCEIGETVSSYRGALIKEHFSRLLKLCGASVNFVENDLLMCKPGKSVDELNIALLNNYPLSVSPDINIFLYSSVIDQNGGKKLDITWDNYLEHIEDELKKISLDKMESIQDPNNILRIKNQAKSCSILQFLAISPLSCIKINTNNNSQNSRSSAFILYNYARLATILERFEFFVSKDFVPQLPTIDRVNFSLLKHTEEWELLWIYIIRFPDMLKDVGREILSQVKLVNSNLVQNDVPDSGTVLENVSDPDNVLENVSDPDSVLENVSDPKTVLENVSDQDILIKEVIEASKIVKLKKKKMATSFPTHYVFKFVHALSHHLSVYYNRIHILPFVSDTGNVAAVQSHLLPTLYARIYLLKNLKNIIEICAELLGDILLEKQM